ncbi:MAG: stalk domain-containing protein [Syntrophomonas sp.]
MFKRRKTYVFGLILLFAFAFLIPGIYQPPQASARSGDNPEVTTKSASEIAKDSAKLKAEIDSVGDSDIEEYGFYYGTDEDDINEKINVGDDELDEGDEFDYDLNDLDSDTKYYFRAYAKNDDGTGYGDVKSFTTYEDDDEDEDEPEVTTKNATDIEEDSARLNAEIDSIGASDIEEYGFCYGKTQSCSEEVEAGDDELDEGDEFDCDLDDLDEDTKYYFKAYAKNDNGTAYGKLKSFKTGSDDDDEDEDDDSLSVTTKEPSPGTDFATLYGVMTCDGGSDIRSYGFYYGTKNIPETKVEMGASDIDENKTFSYKLTGLKSGTTYYVEAYATNKDKTVYGSILDFKTSGSATALPAAQPSTSVTASPIGTSTESVLYIGFSNYKIRGASQIGAVAPYIRDNRTFLPIRPVAYALGLSDANILWDAASRTVTLTKDSKVVKLTINSKTMTINGISQTMDTAPEITGNNTCLPVSPVAKAFGATVTWDAAAQSVTIK